MDELTLAKSVWGHLGQELANLNDGTKEAKLFNSLIDSSKRQVIFKVAPNAFTFPFRPILVKSINDETNEFQGRYGIYAYPRDLIQLIGKSPSPNGNSLYEGTNRNYRTGYDSKAGKKTILLPSSFGNTTLLGIFNVRKLLDWPPQMLETLSLYMAWQLSPTTAQGDMGLRAALKKEYDISLTESKLYDYSENKDSHLLQSSDFTNPIDFEIDSFSSVDTFGRSGF